MKNKYFTTKIGNWYDIHKRNLPWRVSKSPYLVWLSEVILQQTKVEQGLPYYIKFVEQFPTIGDLAVAPEETVLKLWQGLGYYSRARNLHSTAKYITEELHGVFPSTYGELIKLKGVGDYTASAIASFCFDEPKAVVDGNVFRVLGRFFGVVQAQNSTEGTKVYKELAASMLDQANPARHNQAIMEFGALHCKPRAPLCSSCVLATACYAKANNLVDSFPVKIRKKKPKTEYYEYIVLRDTAGRYIFEPRRGKGIWEGLYEFPLLQFNTRKDKSVIFESLQQEYPYQMTLEGLQLIVSDATHKLTHKTLKCRFWSLSVQEELVEGKTMAVIKKLPTSILIAKFIEQRLH